MTVEEIRQKLLKRLAPKYGEGEAKAMTRLIFHHLKGWNSTDLIVNDFMQLSPFVVEKIESLLKRLDKDEPIQYILGDAYFYGMDLKVSPAVLIPRPETEQLVDLIVDKYKEVSDLKILDVGTGSGCIAVALARSLPFPEIYALEVSEDALRIAKSNAENLKVKINFIHRNVFEFAADDESMDIIVSNPPYIKESEKVSMEKNVLEYEPHEALFVPEDKPLILYDKIASLAKEALKPEGRLYFEINPLCAEELRKMLAEYSFNDIEIIKDIHGRERFATARK